MAFFSLFLHSFCSDRDLHYVLFMGLPDGGIKHGFLVIE
jgi:hypothetical protein